MQNTQAVYPNPAILDKPVITTSHLELLQTKLELLQTKVLEQCDALDGIQDQILNDPRDCEFEFDSLPKCPKNSQSDDCFTSSQVDAIEKVYAGVVVNQETIYPGFPYGGENEQGGWQTWITGPNERTMEFNFLSLQFAFGTEMFKYLVFQDPAWDYSTYDYSNFSATTSYASSYLDATSTDYSGFRDRGSKMIIYHGWYDHALSAFATIEHYNAVQKEDSGVNDYLRLFLLPGVMHCAGGPGPWEVDWLELVREWVELGNAPKRVTISKTVEEQTVMERPVYPFPKETTMMGKEILM